MPLLPPQICRRHGVVPEPRLPDPGPQDDGHRHLLRLRRGRHLRQHRRSSRQVLGYWCTLACREVLTNVRAGTGLEFSGSGRAKICLPTT